MPHTLLAMLALASTQAPGDAWVPARPVAVEGLAEASVVAAAGPWLAFVRVLPLPEASRRYHAPRNPWELVRVGPGVAALEVVAESGVKRTGWGAPTFVAVALDGTVTATWRPGHVVVVAPPGMPGVEVVVHDDPGLECVALSTTHLVTFHAQRQRLFAQTLHHDRSEEVVDLGHMARPHLRELVFGAPWLTWLDEARDLAVVDVVAGTRRRVDLDAPAGLVLAGVWNGRLLAYTTSYGALPELRIVDLAAGAQWSLPAPRSVAGCTPEGVLTAGRISDPCDGSIRVLELPEQHLHRVLRRAPGVLWVVPERGAPPVAFDLAAPTVPRPPSAPPLRPLRLPELGADDASAAAREAWRTARH